MALLNVESVTMQFGGLTAVNQVDLAVEEGQIFSVIGPNGAGKTTLFNAITGIYHPTKGRVLFSGNQQFRPLTWKNLVAFLVIGCFAGLLGFIAAVDIDRLWLSAIKRQMTDVFADKKGTTSFYHDYALEDAAAFINAEPAVERRETAKGDRWRVITAEGVLVSANFDASWLAWRARDAIQDGDYSIKNLSSGSRIESSEKELIFAGDAEMISGWEAKIKTMRAEQDWKQKKILGLVMFGFVLGVFGSIVVWRRSRRTTDYIAHSGIARTFQNIRLFGNMTVTENVLIGMGRCFRSNPLFTVLRLPMVRREERELTVVAEEMLDFMGLAGRGQELAKNLPYGDQRRLEIARALACQPKLLLLDEPAAGMNPKETTDLMALIRRIRERGLTILLIEHHMSLVMGISDRIAVLDYGVKIAEGTPLEVKNNPKVIEAYLGKEDVN